jgi:hypothetical protein
MAWGGLHDLHDSWYGIASLEDIDQKADKDGLHESKP